MLMWSKTVLPALSEHEDTLACLVVDIGDRECIFLCTPFGCTATPEAEFAPWLQVDLLFGDEVEAAAQVFREVPKVEAVIPVAAAKGQNVKAVEDWAVSHLPLGPALYPKVQPDREPSETQDPSHYTHGAHPAKTLGSSIVEPLIAMRTHQGPPVTTPLLAGYCQRASRALLCGRDHPGKGVPDVPRGDTLLHYSAPRPSPLQCLTTKLLTVAACTRACIPYSATGYELSIVWSPGADQRLQGAEHR